MYGLLVVSSIVSSNAKAAYFGLHHLFESTISYSMTETVWPHIFQQVRIEFVGPFNTVALLKVWKDSSWNCGQNMLDRPNLD